jgi:hypothetical protein
LRRCARSGCGLRPAAENIQAGVAAIRHIQQKSTPSFSLQISAAIGGLDWHHHRREFVSRISGDEMKPSRVRLPKNVLFSDDARRPDLTALETAKARQDISHQKLDKFIAAALAELSGDDRVA